jgi:membrane-associated phospholipid phosphatase
MGCGIALAAPVANTAADREGRGWYQQNVRSSASDRVAGVVRYGGEFWVALPAFCGAALAGRAAEGFPAGPAVSEWGDRSLRAALVGGPPLLLMQAGLGASRPSAGDSHWHPFRSTPGVSGHTFFGAVPFLTAAAMTDEPGWQVPLLAGSFLSGWSRINDDRHYFSQVALGWCLGYVAVASVDATQAGNGAFRIVPTWSADGPGMGVLLRY